MKFLRLVVGVVAAPLVMVAACSSDDPSPGGIAETDGGSGVMTDAGAPLDGAAVSDARSDADAAATEGMVTSLGSFGTVDLSGLTNALSETTTVSQGSELQVVLAELASCSDVTGGPSANATFLELSLYTAGPAADGGERPRTAATAAGTYNLDLTTAGPYADAYVIPFDSTCHATVGSGKITDGTVTVSAVSPTGVTGTFHLSTGDGVITGSFSTVPCTGAYDLVAPASTARCH
jgi:hypothetical protein